MIVSLVVGLLLIVIGLVLLARPQIVDWVSDQTNLRAIKLWGSGEQYDKAMRLYPRNVRILRVFFPPFFLLVGLVVMLKGAGVLG
jgi:hypothetical protein